MDIIEIRQNRLEVEFSRLFNERVYIDSFLRGLESWGEDSYPLAMFNRLGYSDQEEAIKILCEYKLLSNLKQKEK